MAEVAGSSQNDIDAQLDEVSSKLIELDEEIHRLEVKRSRLEKKKKELNDLKEQNAFKKISGKNWESNDFPWSLILSKHLEETFKMKKFRPLQLSAINSFLSGHDVMVIMPTGGGKSLCYQMSALAANNGFTLVVSPLVSLMEDQILSLTRLNINAAMLNASATKEHVNKVFADMVDSKSEMRLLYVTPEKLAKSKRFMTKLQKSYSLGLFSKLAIDEVHCCSQWGHDFRPDYKFLGVVRNLFPKVPILGLTATCTSQVTEDVKKILRIGQKCLIFKSPLNRPNLFYEVRAKPEAHDACIDALETLLTSEFKGQSGIIYTLTVKDAESLTKDLREKGLKVGCYHANLEPDYRSKVHRRWLSGDLQAVIATIAFGMGIDKSDVRFVIHHSMSKSMENFYQESGRAGRDDRPAKCILFYRFADIFRLSTMVFTEQTGLEKLYGIVAYCLDATTCRRKMISDHFGERWESTDCNAMCDHCRSRSNHSQSGSSSFKSELDISEVAQATIDILCQAKNCDQKMTALKLVEALRGRGASNLKLSNWKPPKIISSDKILTENIIANLLMENYLKEDFHFTPYNTISYLETGSRPVRKPITMTLPASAKNVTVTSETVSPTNSKGKTVSDEKVSNGVVKTKTDSTGAKRSIPENISGREKKKRIVYAEDSSDEDVIALSD